MFSARLFAGHLDGISVVRAEHAKQQLVGCHIRGSNNFVQVMDAIWRPYDTAWLFTTFLARIWTR
jgi:hypothetical protein